MKLIICLENNGGIGFFGRRLSRDIAVYTDICSECKGKKLYIAEKSTDLFENFLNGTTSNSCEINVVTEFSANALDEAISNDAFIFSEDNIPEQYLSQISELVIYKWNRDYPYDEITNIDFSKFRLFSKKEFAGNSHEKITCETYKQI